MTDPTTEFFDALARRGHDPMLARFKGSVRFDIGQGNRAEHYRVVINKGDISVFRDGADADCVIRVDRPLLSDGVAGGRNMMSAFLRGEIGLEGDPQLLVLFQRILPGPRQSSEPVVTMVAERKKP